MMTPHWDILRSWKLATRLQIGTVQAHSTAFAIVASAPFSLTAPLRTPFSCKMEACLSPRENRDTDFKSLQQIEVNETMPPPPYTITSPKPAEERAVMDSLLYQKMLSLESMVSNIHETVVDQGSYLDVSVQLKEINDTMHRFQQEASVRLRKKLTGSLSSRPASMYSQASYDSEFTLELMDTAFTPEMEDSPLEDQQGAEDAVRYQRVCSLLENLITDASSVLQDSPEQLPTVLQPSDEDGTVVFRQEPQGIQEDVGVKLLCEIKHGDSSEVHEIPTRNIMPLLDNEVDLERLALMPVRHQPQADPLFLNESINHSLLASANTTQRTILSLLYWTFLFTIGSILFDSSLCNTAGFQVMSILNSASGPQPRRRSNTIDAPQPQTFTPPTCNPPIVIARRKSL